MTSITKPRPLTRYFNSLIEHEDFYEKKSSKKIKLKQEYDFLSNIPDHLKKYYPSVHTYVESVDHASYMIKKVDILDCSYLMLEKSLYSEQQIIDLIRKVKTYLDLIPSKDVANQVFLGVASKEIVTKNEERVKEVKKLRDEALLVEICQGHGFNDLDDYLAQLNSKITSTFKDEVPSKLYFSHGDLCFSNILCAQDQLFLIDPKGAAAPELNYRPIHYELAKLSQSLIGKYDLINHELIDFKGFEMLFLVDIPIPHLAINEFEKVLESFGTSLKVIRLIEASLFLSLIPFHKDSVKKMKGFLINSINIFKVDS